MSGKYKYFLTGMCHLLYQLHIVNDVIKIIKSFTWTETCNVVDEFSKYSLLVF